MNRGLKIGGLVVLILGAGVGAYFLFRKDEGDSPTPSPNGNKSSGSSKYKNNDFPLKKDSGDIGQSVKRVSALQRYLNDVGSYGLTVDGKFGPKTLNALKEEQSPFDNFKISYPNAVHGEVNENYYNDQVKLYEDASYVAPTNFSGKGRGQTRKDECTEGSPCGSVMLGVCLDNGCTGCKLDDECNGNCTDCRNSKPIVVDRQRKTTSFVNANGTWFDDLEVGY